MSKEYNPNNLTIETFRSAYSKGDVKSTLTIRELIEELEEFASFLGDGAPVFLSFDRGYTYGGIEHDLLVPHGIEEDWLEE